MPRNLASTQRLRTLLSVSALFFGAVGSLTAGEQLLLESRTLARDGTELAVVLPSGRVALSSMVIASCLAGNRNADDIVKYDLDSGLCQVIPAAERNASPLMQRPAVDLGGPGPAIPILDCLVSHRGVLVRDTSRNAICFSWYQCEDLNPAIVGPDHVCAGSSVFLDAGAGYTDYLWGPGGETTQIIDVTPGADTLYEVTVADEWTCVGADVHLVTVAPLPEPEITGPSSVCEGSSVTLDAGPGYGSYTWEPGGETTPQIEVTPAISTVYNVTVTDAYACSATSPGHAVEVTVCTQTIFSDDFETGSTGRWSHTVSSSG